MFFVWWMLNGMTLLLEYFWQIFVFQMYSVKIKNFYLIFLYITVIFTHFYNVFALDSPKIFSVFNSCLPGPRWSHIVLEYNNKNMRFIRLLIANQIACIFRSNDNILKTFNNSNYLHSSGCFSRKSVHKNSYISWCPSDINNNCIFQWRQMYSTSHAVGCTRRERMHWIFQNLFLTGIIEWLW